MSDRFFNEQAMRRKLQELRAEQARQEKARELERQREAAAKRPHCQRSEQAMDKLCQRIIARAERHKRADQDKRWGIVPRPAAPTARARWQEAVAEAVAECGGDRMKATALASRRHPGLREAYVAEVNGR